MQRLTTREPDDAQIEIGITALKAALCDEFPELPLEKLAGTDDTYTFLTDALLAKRAAEQAEKEQQSEQKSETARAEAAVAAPEETAQNAAPQSMPGAEH